MDAKDTLYLHELTAIVANKIVEGHPDVNSRLDKDYPVTVLDPAADNVFDLKAYHSTGTRPKDLHHEKPEHREALFELTNAVTDELDELPELDIDLSSNPEEVFQNRETTLEPEEDTANEGPVEEDPVPEWNIPDENTVKYSSHIRNRLDGVDSFTSEILKDLLNMEARIKDGSEEYHGRINRFNQSLSVFEISGGERNHLVENPDLIDLKNSDIELRIVDPDELDISPLAVKDHDESRLQDYISDIASWGSLMSLPRVRPTSSIASRNSLCPIDSDAW